MSETNMKFKVLSLFSGAMGLDIGLERTDRFETIGCVEVEASCCETIRRNRDAGRFANPDMTIIHADITTLDPLEVLDRLQLKPGELDLIAGGPPCQAFSVFGKRRGLADSRGQLIFQLARFVEFVRPRVFVMENVRGLLSMVRDPKAAKGSMFEMVQRRFNEIGYRTDCFVVNSVNYGAPQIRERLIIIGNRFNLKANFKNPTHSDRPEEGLKPFAVLGDAIRGQPDPDPTVMDFSPRKKHYLSMIPPGGNWRSLPVEIQKESMGKTFYFKGGRSAYWRKLSYEFPCPTIVTMPNHAGTSLCHPEELRPLTVGECARVQEFPEHWEFVGTAAQKYKQVGNAVPVILGEVTGEAVVELLERTGSIEHPLIKTPLPDTIVHLRPHVRTRWWWKNGQVIEGVPYSKQPNRNENHPIQLSLFDLLPENTQ